MTINIVMKCINKYIYVKNHQSCSNCGSNKHSRKKCNEPVTSWGIILVNISHDDNTKNKKICHDQISVLLVGRKYSLGFVEFIRGRYNQNNVKYIFNLGQQMLEHEINLIKNNKNNFENLWKIYWQLDFINDPTIEFINSKNKFNELISIHPEIFDNVKPLFSSTEFGFPKGRKKKYENGKECAIREFCEETGLKVEDITISENIKPFEENLIGTNGIQYKHIYYVAEANNKVMNTDFTPFYNNEINQIKIVKISDALHMIRSYHIDKINILVNLAKYYISNHITN